ncbi:MAG: hypothetical protein HYX54_07155 [Chloroflexi bacterium]|nr:hypothetical protein [Chloroflexota bacterium]
MTFLRRIWGRDDGQALTACTALDIGTEFAKALVFDIDDERRGIVRGVGRKRQGLSHMQSGTVADISAVVDNCSVALQEAEEMAGFRPRQVVIGIAGELVKGFTTTTSQERSTPPWSERGSTAMPSPTPWGSRAATSRSRSSTPSRRSSISAPSRALPRSSNST